MSAPHTVNSRVATFAASVLVFVQLLVLLQGGHDSYVDALLFSLVAVTAGAGAELHRSNSIESRWVVGLLAGLSGCGVLLVSTAGVPGQDGGSWGLLSAVLFGVSAAVIAFIVADGPRRPAERRGQKSYAS